MVTDQVCTELLIRCYCFRSLGWGVFIIKKGEEKKGGIEDKGNKEEREKVKVQGRKTARGLWPAKAIPVVQGQPELHKETLPHKNKTNKPRGQRVERLLSMHTALYHQHVGGHHWL